MSNLEQLQAESKPIEKESGLTEEDFNIEKRKFLSRELLKASKYLEIPIVGRTLYEIAKFYGYER